MNLIRSHIDQVEALAVFCQDWGKDAWDNAIGQSSPPYPKKNVISIRVDPARMSALIV
jgi:hypothetical protein